MNWTTKKLMSNFVFISDINKALFCVRGKIEF